MTSIHVSYLVCYHENTLKQGYEVWKYRIFRTIRYTPKFGRKRGYVSYSPNVAYLAHWGGGWGAAVEQNLFSYFPLKPRCVLCSGASYSPKNTELLGYLAYLSFMLLILHLLYKLCSIRATCKWTDSDDFGERMQHLLLLSVIILLVKLRPGCAIFCGLRLLACVYG